MGNRLSRKRKAVAASTQAVPPVPLNSEAPKQSDQTLTSLSAQKDEALPDRNDIEQPLLVHQVSQTARDDNEEDPLEFFRRCYELEGDPFTLYTQALMLKNQRQFAAASDLLRCLVANPNLTLEAQHHLAQCLIAMDPALNWCRKEATQCLKEVVAATKSLSNGADAHHSMMYRESLELLAYVMIAEKCFDLALELLETLQDDIGREKDPSSHHSAHRQQQTLVSFQVAFCRFARGESVDIVSSELLRTLPQKLDPKLEQQQEEGGQEPETIDPLEGIELLLHADIASLRQGLALLASTST